MKINFEQLDKIYKKYNKRCFVHPDPLEFLYNYDDKRDIEIVGLIASSLAYGKVVQILKSIRNILSKLNPNPYEFILNNSEDYFANSFKGFKHRFTTEHDMVKLFSGIKAALELYGSLESCFISGFSNKDETYLPAMINFTKILNSNFENSKSYLLPSPENGSACKRLMLFLRWMIRNDEVDPGPWSDLDPSKLIYPLDTHMYQISSKFGFTKRKSADMKTALDITCEFRKFNLLDPVKYDFALTRFGIRDELTYSELFQCHKQVRIYAP